MREGSVLCLEDRQPLGRIEEILGPVVSPIYALRYAGTGGPMPASLGPGTCVCSVDRLSHKLEEGDLSAKVTFSCFLALEQIRAIMAQICGVQQNRQALGQSSKEEP